MRPFLCVPYPRLSYIRLSNKISISFIHESLGPLPNLPYRPTSPRFGCVSYKTKFNYLFVYILGFFFGDFSLPSITLRIIQCHLYLAYLLLIFSMPRRNRIFRCVLICCDYFFRRIISISICIRLLHVPTYRVLSLTQKLSGLRLMIMIFFFRKSYKTVISVALLFLMILFNQIPNRNQNYSLDLSTQQILVVDT